MEDNGFEKLGSEQFGAERGGGKVENKFTEEELWEIEPIIDSLYDQDGHPFPDEVLAERNPNPLNELVNLGCDFDWARSLELSKQDLLEYIIRSQKAAGVTQNNELDGASERIEAERHNIKVPLHKNYPIEVRTSCSRIKFVRDDHAKTGLSVELCDVEGKEKIVKTEFLEGENVLNSPGIPKITIECGKVSPDSRTVDVSIYQEATDVRKLNRPGSEQILAKAA